MCVRFQQFAAGSATLASWLVLAVRDRDSAGVAESVGGSSSRFAVKRWDGCRSRPQHPRVRRKRPGVRIGEWHSIRLPCSRGVRGASRPGGSRYEIPHLAQVCAAGVGALKCLASAVLDDFDMARKHPLNSHLRTRSRPARDASRLRLPQATSGLGLTRIRQPADTLVVSGLLALTVAEGELGTHRTDRSAAGGHAAVWVDTPSRRRREPRLGRVGAAPEVGG